MHRGAPKEETSLNHFSLGVVATAGPENHAGEHEELSAVGVRLNRTCIPAARQQPCCTGWALNPYSETQVLGTTEL